MSDEAVASDLSRTVKVGGEEYTVSRFRGYKATRIMREAAAIGRKYPKIAKLGAKFEQDYIEENALRLSRTEAEQRFGDAAREISDKAWEQTGGELPIRRLPTPSERMAAILPDLLAVAEDRVLTLLALVSASNEDLRTHDEADDIDEWLTERGKTLLHTGDVEELVELATAGFEVGRAQFAPLEQRLGKALQLLGIRQPAEEGQGEETGPEDGPSSPTSSETPPSSSIDSPMPTDGDEQTSSTESLGSSSEPSPVA